MEYVLVDAKTFVAAVEHFEKQSQRTVTNKSHFEIDFTTRGPKVPIDD